MFEGFVAVLVKNIWGIILTFVGLVAWFTRLEWLAKTNRAMIMEDRKKLEKLENKIDTDIKEIHTKLDNGFNGINSTLQQLMYKVGRNDRYGKTE